MSGKQFSTALHMTIHIRKRSQQNVQSTPVLPLVSLVLKMCARSLQIALTQEHV